MRIPTLTAALFLAASAGAAPAFAAGPVGDWVCTNSHDETPAGSLALTATSYTYTYGASAILRSETGRLRVDGDTVTFVDGPLPQMGIGVGTYSLGTYYPPYFDAKSSEARSQLALGYSYGQEMVCGRLPDYVEP